MGYMHIDNLYKNRAVMAFKQLYALEKIHGTSAHVSWSKEGLKFYSGGESHEKFVGVFNVESLTEAFTAIFGPEPQYDVTIYGEAYGGKQQGMSPTYGPSLKFAAFDVKIGDFWQSVPNAVDLVGKLGLEFVDYVLIDAEQDQIDRERDRPSVQAVRNGITEPKEREGVVLRPPYEVQHCNGERIIAKHKGEKFSERGRPKVELDPTKAEARSLAYEAALLWTTPMRLEHVIDQLIRDREVKSLSMSDIPAIVRLMNDDIVRESVGELEVTKDVSKAIGAQTVMMFKSRLMNGVRSE